VIDTQVSEIVHIKTSLHTCWSSLSESQQDPFLNEDILLIFAIRSKTLLSLLKIELQSLSVALFKLQQLYS